MMRPSWRPSSPRPSAFCKRIGTTAGVPASAAALQAAMKRNAPTEAGVDQAIQSLTQRSLVVFRRHTGSYALWEGSDVDFDDRLQAARQAVERDQNLADFPWPRGAAAAADRPPPLFPDRYAAVFRDGLRRSPGPEAGPVPGALSTNWRRRRPGGLLPAA